MIDLRRGPCRALVVSRTATMTKFIDTPSRQTELSSVRMAKVWCNKVFPYRFVA